MGKKKEVLVVLGAFILSVFSVAAVAGQVAPPAAQPVLNLGVITAGMDVRGVPVQSGEPVKLQISPRDKWFELKPGSEKEFTVKVRNKNEAMVSASPRIVVQPSGEYTLEKEWITIEPGSAELKSGEEREFTVKVRIPGDAEIGQYSTQIVFTNDTIPMPYPVPFPAYINSMRMSIHVWEPPKITIQPQYIRDRLEAGQSQEYEIQLENRGDKAIAINPEVDGEGSHCMGPGCPGEIPADWISIESPSKVDANSKATVRVAVNVPADAKGRYEASINLNMDDPSVERWNHEVRLSIEVWKQPTEPFREEFSVKSGENVKIVISANQYGYDKYSDVAGDNEEPAFDVTLRLAALDGGVLEPEAVKTVKTEHISLGSGFLSPRESASGGMYHVMSTQYCETYEVKNATGGVWSLEILPRNVERFEYTIEIGG